MSICYKWKNDSADCPDQKKCSYLHRSVWNPYSAKSKALAAHALTTPAPAAPPASTAAAKARAKAKAQQAVVAVPTRPSDAEAEVTYENIKSNCDYPRKPP